MNEDKIIFCGKFYLKNGIIIEEEVEANLKVDNELELVTRIEQLKEKIKDGFKGKFEGFQITFGNTIFRGEDISAITLTTK